MEATTILIDRLVFSADHIDNIFYMVMEVQKTVVGTWIG
jgi:hypothetical protein